MSKRVHIKSYGCQMNVHDSERMAGLLVPLGYAQTDTAEGADLVILNTCHIRERAAEKVYSELGKLRRLKTGGAGPTIAVAGCMAQAEGEEILRRAPGVDLVFGPQTYHRLPEMLARRARAGAPLVDTEFPAEDKFDRMDIPLARGVTAFLTVQEGCDKFCTFCVVPYTRGAEVSRSVSKIVAEAENLAAGGVREITLLGQNVNAYHGAGPDGGAWTLARLIARLARIDGLDRLRFVTSHPRDMGRDLIDELSRNPKLMPYLHLPIQAGSDRVLEQMNRGHTAGHYVRLIESIREARPDIAISGDFIVGFPGETEADFQATLEVVRELKYASAFSFAYSPRPGTPAAERADQVDGGEKKDRLHRLQALLEEQRQSFNAACVGLTLPVLIEKPGRFPGQLGGRTPYLQAVHLPAKGHRIGDIVQVRIDALGAHSLSGHSPMAA